VSASFRPPQQVCALRSVLRHRKSLIGQASEHVLHMHKSLDQMNIKIHRVLSDITGLSGMAMLDAILAGRRDPRELAALADRRVKRSKEDIAKSLTGDWRPEHVFTLRQSLALYRTVQALIAECDEQIAILLADFDAVAGTDGQPVPKGAKPSKTRGNNIRIAGTTLREQMYRLFGTDLTQIPGVGPDTAHSLFAELGNDLTPFGTDKRFASWAGLCPDNRVSGGRVLSVKTRDIKSRVADIFRMAACSASKTDSHLGDFYRRMAGRMGKPQAITATAHKIAHIFFHLVTNRVPYDASIYAKNDALHAERRVRRIMAQAAKYGLELAPVQHGVS
jgi:transposase